MLYIFAIEYNIEIELKMYVSKYLIYLAKKMLERVKSWRARLQYNNV